jgi:hypothetical protein
MAVGVGINNLGNTSVANTNDLFIIGVRSEADDGQGNIVVSYDTQGITYSNLRTNLDFVDLGDLSVTEVAAVDGTEPSIEYDANTGVFTYTKPYLLSNTEIRSLFTAEDAKITVSNGVVGLGSVSTTDISEGNKLFYTTSRATSDARAAISVSGSLAYNSSTGAISYTERTDDEIRDLFSGALGVTFDDNSGEISIGQDVSTTADVTFDTVTADSFTAGGATVYNNTIKLSNNNANTNWVGVIDQATASNQQRLIIGSGNGLTGTGVVPQGAYTAWYGPSDVNYPSQIRNTVRDDSTQKTAGGFYANGQMWGAFGADITGDMTVSGTITGTLDGTASDVESISNFSTSDLNEGTNLYFTNARSVAALSSASTSDLPEGSRLYHTSGRVTSIIESTSIDALSDVDTVGAVDGSLLSWNSGTSKWESVSSKDNMPIGTIQWYAGTSANVPAGWLECDGQQVTATYPTLRQFLIDSGNPFGTASGNPLLPDLRGRFARGYDPSATNSPYAAVVGTYQTDAFKTHNHGAGTLQTAEAGAHTHVVGGNDGDNVGSQKLAPYLRRDDAEFDSTDPGSIRAAGAHTHTLTGSTANAPTSGDGNETRPMNISFIPIIKAWGTLLNSSNLGVADIANLLNNIASQSEAETGTNNTKFMSPLRTRQAIDDRVDTLTGWQTTETTNAPTASNAVWGGSTGSGASTLVGFTHKRAYSSGLEMKNCSVEGLRLNANRKHIWIDVGYFLYGFSASIPMSWDHYPTSHTVQFEITTATLGFAVGDRITLPTNSDHPGTDEGNSQFFRLVNADGTNRLRFYIYGHDRLGDITGFNSRGGVLYPQYGNFIVNMSKQGPIF